MIQSSKSLRTLCREQFACMAGLQGYRTKG